MVSYAVAGRYDSFILIHKRGGLPTSGMTARVSSWRFLPVALAMVLPVLLCVGWSWFHAVGEVRKDASIAAGVVRVQTGTILTQARELLVRLVDLTARTAARPCPPCSAGPR